MSRPLPALIAVGWLALLGCGIAALHRYDSRPGPSGRIAELRPDGPVPSARPALVLFAHPRCPCTRASLAALARLAPVAGEGLEIRVVFVGPAGADAAWWAGRNWESATAVPGASVERDAGGATARRYGVRTSGHVVVHAGDGRLRFSGGISLPRDPFPARAPLAAELDRLLADPAASPVREAVRGCPLFGDPDE